MKFSDLLNLNKESMMPDSERVLKRATRKHTGLKIAGISAASLCAAAALVIAGIWLFSNPAAKPIVETVNDGAINVIKTVSAAEGELAFMDDEGELLIKTTENVAVKELKKRISIQPQADFSLKKSGDCSYVLSFSKPLAQNTLYNLEAVFAGRVVYRWAFQTETNFCITGSAPAEGQHTERNTAIEIIFSHADISGFEEAFSISPKVAGSFQQYGRTMAFIPDAPLDPATLYTVTIDKGVTGPNGTSLAKDYRFSFSTDYDGQYAFMIYQDHEAADTFLPDEKPISVISYNDIDVSSADVRLYAFESCDAYIDAYKKYVRNGEVSAEITDLQLAPRASFKATPVLAENYCGIYEKAAFINYPEPLAIGYYYAEIEIGGKRLYQLLQSTNLSVYTLATNGDYVVWVNDSKAGKPCEGMEVSLEGFGNKKTGANGTAFFGGAEEEANMRALKVGNQSPYVVLLRGDARDPEIDAANRYYSYISTNSKLYRSDDIVGVFGAIMPRAKNAKLPSDVVLRCDIDGKEYNVDIGKNGAFELKLPLNNTANSSACIELYINDCLLDSTYITIANYELPVYRIAVKTDRSAYMVGDTAQAEVQVTYFDGTPARGVYIRDWNDMGLSGYTDKDGLLRSSFTVAPLYSDFDYVSESNQPQVRSVGFVVEDGSESSCEGYADYIVFDAPQYLEGRYQDGKVLLSGSDVDVSKVSNTKEEEFYKVINDKTAFEKAAANCPVYGELHEVVYTKEIEATTYDPINKKTVYSYRYNETDNILRSFEAQLEDGQAELEFDEKSDEERHYYVILWPENSTGAIRIDLYDYQSYVSNNELSYYFTADENYVNIGDSINLIARDTQNQELLNSGSVLYSMVCGEIVETCYSEFPQYTMNYKERHAPDIQIYGAYFDGKHIYSLGSEYVSYNTENAQLKIELLNAPENTSPGDRQDLEFRVTDQEGKPVACALNISVLDSALFETGGEFTSPLDLIYHSRSFSSEVYTTVSHRDFKNGEGLYGEGGGGDGEPRRDFEDAPYFETIHTNAKGEGKISFVLPDSITEWTIVARAISKDVRAGMEHFALTSEKDYFVFASLVDKIKETDDFVVALKGESKVFTEDDASQFTVTLSDQDGTQIDSRKVAAANSNFAYLNFGELQKGYYTVYIEGESGGKKDSLLYSLDVVENLNTVWIHNAETIKGDALALQLKPQAGNVTLTIADESYAFWQEAMARLRSNSGERVDQVLGAYLAEQYYESGRWMNQESLDYSIVRPYMEFGGVRMFQNSEEEDLRLSAKLAAVAPQFCNRNELKWYFENYINNRYAAKIDVITAYFGLAALGEPVLSDLHQIYKAEAELSVDEGAYLALAFAYGGDYTTAEYIFEEYLGGNLGEEEGLARIVINEAVSEELTGCAALLANRLSLDSADAFMKYIIKTDTSETLLSLELIGYLNDRVNYVEGKNVISITTADGKTKSYTYAKNEVLSLSLVPEQSCDMKIANQEGVSVVGYSYKGMTEELAALSGGIQFKTFAVPDKMERTEWSTLSFSVDIPKDFDQASLEMVLPAGLIYDYCVISAGERSYTVAPHLNKREISAALPQGRVKVEISVMGAMPGEYQVEPIVISHSGDSRFLYTPTSKVIVTE